MAVEAGPKDETEPVGGDRAGRGERSGWSRGQIAILALAVVGLVAVFVFTRGGDDPTEEASPSPGQMDDQYETFIDPQTGFSLEHPETWVPIARPDSSRRLVLSAGGQNTVSVRYNEDFTKEPVTDVEDLAALQAVTDRIAGGEGVQVLQREALMVNDMPTIYYLSRFTDEASGAKGVNAQHFVFQGTDMYILLFQAFPEEEFDRLAPDFDKIRASFRGDPDYVAPEPTETTAPPAPTG